MAFWRQLSRGIRALTNRSRTDRDVADEVQDYLDHATAAHVARGLSTDEAQRAARLELGSAAAVRDEIRDYGWENIVETTIADVRYAARGLRAAPTFTVVAAITLALGIGATTAIFSALKPIVFEPLPYPNPDRVVMVWELANNGVRIDGTFGMYRWLVERNRAFESLAVIRSWLPTLTADEPERLAGERVSASYFRVLGVTPALGTDFQPSHDQPNGPTVIILSHGFWQRRFASDPGIIGRQVTLDDVTYTVIGVMPKGFDNVLAPAADVWAPLQYAMSQGRAWGHHLRLVGRLRSDVTLDQASREVDSLGQAALKELNPPTYGQQLRMGAVPLGDDITRAIKPALVVISAGVALVLVIACVNVTNLLLARGVRRRGEYAVRVALGAGRRRLVRLLLTEGLLVAFLGSVIGLGVATLGVNALVALSPPELPRLDAIRIDGIVFAFAAAMATVIGLGVGLIPALQAARSDPQQDLLHSSRRLSGGHHRARRALVIAQVALAIMLLVGSGLLLRSLHRLFAIPSGFDSSQMLTMQVHPASRFSDADAATAFYGRILDTVRQVPGVASADVTSQLPLSGDRDGYGVQFESNPNQGFSSFRYSVSPGYAKTMRIALRQGRVFTNDDRNGAPRVALISESLAAQQFGKASPLGERLRIGATDGPAFTIVGVVADLKQMSLTGDEPAAVYTTLSQSPFVERSMSLVVRARGNPRDLTSSIRGAIASTGRNFVVTRIATMDDLVAATAAERQFALVLFEAFALASLVLAGAGIYGLLAGSVAERTREISVRAALGASRGAIVGLVLRQGLTLTAIGIAIGLGGAAISSRAMDTLLFGISRLDPPTYGGVAILLSAVALMACLVPAWRAARVDPAATLRTE